MRHFTAGELARLQDTQDGAMQDTCVVCSYSATQDDWGNPSATYTDGDALACGFEHGAPDEIQESGDVPRIDGRLRLPLGTTLDERDRVRVTHRYGVELTSAETYEVVGPARRGPSGLYVDLRLVGSG